LSDVVNSFLLVFAGLFPIVNPLGSAPIFLNLTRHCSDGDRKALAWRIAVNGFLLLLGSLFVGSFVLEFFGITLPVVRIAGGLVVTAMGWKLLSADDPLQEQRAASADATHGAPPDAFYPLTMPLTVGPGSISVAITLGSHRPAEPFSFSHFALLAGAATAGLFAIAAVIYVSYLFAANLMSIIGEGGTNVVLRLSAFILMCIGIQIVWAGVQALMLTMHST
jgi:multiple antibiotic resistance protein